MSRRREKLRVTLRALAANRDALSKHRRTVESQEAAYKATEEYQEYLGGKELEGNILDAIRLAEHAVRELTLATYAETGNKKPVSGVGVRVYTKYDYDAGKALAWCKAFAPSFVIEQLDTKAFKKVADTLASQGAPVTIREDPRPTIAKDLSEYVEKPQ